MPEYQVSIKAQLENVTNIQAPGEDFQYCIKVKCNSCNEVSEKWLYVSADEQVNVPKSRGTCNLVYKCKLCNRAHTLDVLTAKKKAYMNEDVPRFKAVISFECRGMGVADFSFGKGWQCEGADSKTLFEELDLDEDWCDYDEEAKCPVGITELEYKVH